MNISVNARYLVVLILSALAVLGSTPLLAAPIVVSGIVVNETAHHPASGAAVELLRATDGESTVITQTRTNTEGRFTFAPQEVGEKEILVVRAEWDGFNYVTPAYDGEGRLEGADITVDPQKVRLAVFESTTEIAALDFTVHHLAIESKQGGLKCVERIMVENPTRKTFLGVGEGQASLLINLPEGAKNVEIDPQTTNAKIEKRPDGWAITKPIPPSVYDPQVLVIINYEVDWPSTMPWERKVDLSRKLQYPTKFFFVAREESDNQLEVTSPLLSEDQHAPLNIAGHMETRIINAVGGPMSDKMALNPSDVLEIEVASPVNSLFWGFLGFIVLLCVAIPLALWKRGGPPETTPGKIGEPKEATGVNGGTFVPSSTTDTEVLTESTNSRNLIERIVLLEEEFQRGEISETEFSISRAALKSKLVDQLLQENPQSPQN